MNGQYNIGDVVLGSWTLVRLLGEGAYGKVYEAHRVEYQNTYTAAVKIMTIPSSPSEIESARAEGMDDESIRAYFDGFVGSVVNEFTLMSELKGTANIVSCEDFRVIPHTEGLGWDILIRMELLTPMLKYMSGREMTRSDVIKLGVDMCKALELCQRYNIIHRDIKPENIFLSRTGDYKLGDFGVARTLEKTTGGLSKKGTYTYMAPEIYRDEKYGPTVDIYSLGIVLYRLLNNNRAPLLPPPPQPITHGEREKALLRRISGEELPPPANADDRLGEIVLKACAFEAKDRYQSPQQMRQELEAIQSSAAEEPLYESKNPIRVERSQYTGHSKSVDSVPSAPKKKKKTGLIAAIAAALVLGAVALLVLLPKLKQSDPRVDTTPAPVEETVPPVETPEATPEPTPVPTPEPVYEPEPSSEPETAEEEPWVEGDWSWTLKGGTLTIRGTGNMANFRYDSYYSGYFRILDMNNSTAPWACKADSITKVVIEDGITSIGAYAFYGLTNVASVSIPPSVTVIGERAFAGCLSLTDLRIPENVRELGVGAIKAYSGSTTTYIKVEVSPNNPYFKSVEGVHYPDGVYPGDELFSADGKTYLYHPMQYNWEILVPEGVTAIAGDLFRSFGGTCAKLPASLSEIGAGAFANSPRLTKFVVAEGNPYLKAVGGVVYSADGLTLVCFPSGRKANYRIPDGVTAIGEGAFAGCELSGVTIPKSVDSIGEGAFSDSSLTSVAIPAGITRIGDRQFSGCRSLRRVSLPSSVTEIGDRAFSGCEALTSIAFPESLTAIGSYAFYQCSQLSRVTIPASVAELGTAAFARCPRLSKIDVEADSASFRAIDGVLFTADGKTLLCFPAGKAGESYTIPEGVTAIADYAFAGCKLSQVIIPEGVTAIGEYAFFSSENLSSVSILGKISVIERSSFSSCTALRTVSVPEGVTLIGESAFSGCTLLTSVTLPQSLAKVGSAAFFGCDALKTVRFRGGRPLWNIVKIEDPNEPLTEASFSFGAA